VARQAEQAAALSTRAQAVARFHAQHGASFYDELAAGTGCCAPSSRTRSASSSPRARSTPTASPALRALLVPSERGRVASSVTGAGAR
jgi:hypothetical protein